MLCLRPNVVSEGVQAELKSRTQAPLGGAGPWFEASGALLSNMCTRSHTHVCMSMSIYHTIPDSQGQPSSNSFGWL